MLARSDLFPSKSPAAKGISVDASKAHYGFLDSYRALLALGVVISHATSIWFRESVPAHLQWLQFGHAAVCGFIVLSGFVLMIPVMKSGGLRGTYRDFMMRRAKRILPPYYFFVAITLAMGVLQLVRHGSSNLTPLKAFAEIFLLRDLFPFIDNGAGGILWTVCLEWKLYFLFPLFVVILKKWGPAALIATSLTVAALWAAFVGQFFHLGDWSHTAPWFAVLFCLGMVACKYAFEANHPKIPAFFAGGAAIGYGLSAIASSDVARLALNDVGNGCLEGLFLWFLMQPRWLPQVRTTAVNALSLRPLIFVGTFGYSIYLFHLFGLRVGMKVASKLNGDLHINGDTAFAVALGTCLVAALVVCYIGYWIAERPFVTKKVATVGATAVHMEVQIEPRRSVHEDELVRHHERLHVERQPGKGQGRRAGEVSDGVPASHSSDGRSPSEGVEPVVRDGIHHEVEGVTLLDAERPDVSAGHSVTDAPSPEDA